MRFNVESRDLQGHKSSTTDCIILVGLSTEISELYKYKAYCEGASYEILHLLRYFHVLFVKDEIDYANSQETEGSLCDEQSKICLTAKDFEKYLNQAREMIPYGILDELEQYLFTLTGGMNIFETSIVSKIKDETAAQVFTTYQDFNAMSGSYRTLCEEMYDSYSMGRNNRDGVSKESFDELLWVLS